jgi:hypothetical protein
LGIDNERNVMELEELYNSKRRLENKIDNFLSEIGNHTGDPYYQDLLEDLDMVEEEIEELKYK